MVEVPRAKVVELLGLPADVSDEDLGRALTQALESAGEAALVSAAEAGARAEDRSIVTAAVNEGRLPATRIAFWLDALSRDRAGCRSVIASLAPGPKPPVPVQDPDVEAGRQGVMASLKRSGIDPPPRPVAAAAASAGTTTDTYAAHAYGEIMSRLGSRVPQASGSAVAASAASNVLPHNIVAGIDQPGIPDPVLLHKGKAPEGWTKDEQFSYFAHKLGCGLQQLVAPPPRPDGWYQPSPNDTSTPVPQPDGSVDWVPKPNVARRI
jgi:hypothetical protein